jgi:hypothetical protein
MSLTLIGLYNGYNRYLRPTVIYNYNALVSVFNRYVCSRYCCMKQNRAYMEALVAVFPQMVT